MSSDSDDDSLESLGSALTSCSSQASVKIYEEKLKPVIDAVRNSKTPLEELVNAAQKIVTEKFAPDSRSTYTYEKGSERLSVRLDEIMSAMLTYVEECGGDSGKRYVASAILACSEVEDVVESLEALGTTWLTHFLFIFKTTMNHSTQSSKRISELATPTLDETASHLLNGLGHRKKSFADDVKKRDGYKCVVTELISYDHPRRRQLNQVAVTLESSHILCRALGNFKGGLTSQSFKSALITFDILVNFTGLLVENLEDLGDLIDQPTNGMLLQHDAHNGFDKFQWYLQKTDKDDVYDLKKFEPQLLIPENVRVSFEDHADDFRSDPSKRERPVDLPKPHYFAIHAAIAQVLHMTNAGHFFDKLLRNYRDEDVRNFSELEAVIGEELLTEAVTEAVTKLLHLGNS
ncbi:hypothetical protein B0H34DRAFT_808436 [Crassisporium funariophilum]|nr:hypothetical protein B0H34DRAFT_808436 [Crassisporium funariophilum]